MTKPGPFGLQKRSINRQIRAAYRVLCLPTGQTYGGAPPAAGTRRRHRNNRNYFKEGKFRMRSNEDIEKLKRNWLADPHWDLEDTKGFEEHRAELIAFSENHKLKWEAIRAEDHRKLASKLCPFRLFTVTSDRPNQRFYENAHCQVENCALWNDADGCCSFRARY